MKIISSTVEVKGECVVVLEESDDLWVLYNILEADDLVTAPTLRKIAKEGGACDRRKGSASEKRRVTLTLRVVTATYDAIADVVRVSGVVVSENDAVRVGAHHTSELAVRTKVRVAKAGPWDVVSREALTLAADRRRGELSAVLLDATSGSGRVYALTEALVRSVGAVDVAMPKNKAAAYGAKNVAGAVDKFHARLREVVLAVVDWSNVRCVALGGQGADAFHAFLLKSCGGGPGEADTPEHAMRAALAGGKFAVVGAVAGRATHADALRALLEEPSVRKRVAETSLATHLQALDDLRAAEQRDETRVLSLAPAIEDSKLGF